MKKLKNGWVEGSVEEFLGLSKADVEYIETRRALRRRRTGRASPEQKEDRLKGGTP
jgi:hypothetical protein